MAMSWKGALGSALIVVIVLAIVYRVAALKAIVIPAGA
jgi:hypothetical protein